MNVPDFTTTEFSHDGVRKPVFRAGEGPAVIVMTEGRKLTEGPFDLVRRDPTVIEAYLGAAA